MIPKQISLLNHCKLYLCYILKAAPKYFWIANSFAEINTIDSYILETNQVKKIWNIETDGNLLECLDTLDIILQNTHNHPLKIWLNVTTQELISLKNPTAFTKRILGYGAKVRICVALHLPIKLNSNPEMSLWKFHLQEVAKLLENSELGRVCLWTYELNQHSSPWADDLYMKASDSVRNEIFFYPSNNFLHGLDETGSSKFHTMMFFASQSKKLGTSLARRLYHKRWADRMFNNNAISIANEPVAERLIRSYYPDKEEWNSSLRSLISGKLSQMIKRGNRISGLEKIHPAIISNPRKWKKVLITGWYGTETNGDKAILGEVIHFIREQSSNCKIILTTIYLPVSMQTNLELDELKDVELVSIYKKNFDIEVNSCDAVIMGGGPMMETSEMDNVLRIFETANHYKKARIIFGCGVGPFHGPRYENVTKRVITLCTAGFFRDKESWEYANRLVPGNNLKYACDPAIGYIHRWRKNNLERINNSGAKSMVSLLRANTGEFTQGVNYKDLEEKNHHSAEIIANLLTPFLMSIGMKLSLMHMNAPWVGGDDRLFNRMVEAQMSESVENMNIREYYTLDHHLVEMSSSQMAIAMRYHGHIFSMALGLPFVSIDYTGKKGKVSSLIERIGYSKYSMNWGNMESENNLELLQQVYNNKEQLSKHLLDETEKLVALLHTTYKDVFLTNH